MTSVQKWKPGDVAMVVNYGGEEKICRLGKFGGQWIFSDGSTMPVKGTSARPLVVIDPEDREQVERLAKANHECDHIASWSELHNATRVAITDALVFALREFASPTPQIEEPTGLGAVVEDANGCLWMRGNPLSHLVWFDPTSDFDNRHWGQIDVVRVLSEGIEVPA